MPHRAVIDPWRLVRREIHRYWRILFTSFEDAKQRLGLDEIEFWDRPFARRLAGTVTASGSSDAAHDIAYSQNQEISNSNYWQSNTIASGAIWCQMDGGVPFELAAVCLVRGDWSGATISEARNFEVQWSDDAATWTTLWSGTAAAGTNLPAGGLQPQTFHSPAYRGSVVPEMNETTDLAYWLRADGDLQSAPGVPCVDGSGIATAANYGSAEDFAQASNPLRPLFRTGGLNGLPYIEGDGTRYFSDILFTADSGLLTPLDRAVGALVSDLDLSASPPLLGSTVSNAKTRWQFLPSAGAQIWWYKNGLLHGDVADPMRLMLSMNQLNNGNLNELLNGVFTRVVSGGGSSSTGITQTQLLRNSVLSAVFKGRLYELFAWVHSKPPMVHNRVDWYLKAKYGL